MINWNIFSPNTVSTTADKKNIDQYINTIESHEIGFFRLPNQKDLLQSCKQVYQKFSHKKYFVHVGIGGSSLGPEMLLRAIPSGHSDMKFVFINNIDPDDFKVKLNQVVLSESIIYIVSKSGTTAETIAAMSILIKELQRLGVRDSELKNYFVLCTDPVKGDLRELAKKYEISCLDIPPNVGGRFSVLTPVGLFPALCAGLKADELLAGAVEIQNQLSKPDSSQNFYQLGNWLIEVAKNQVSQTVMMPYSSLLKEFSAWFVQLWAESLGKDGVGLTPIPAYGATDQHSQMQLFMDGPSDKVLFLLEIEKFGSDFSLESNLTYKSFESLSSHSLSQLMKAELEGTLVALKEKNKHLVHLKIPELNERYLGQLILFFECLTVYVGICLKVDPFNQPGVEAGKKYAYLWLKNLGK